MNEVASPEGARRVTVDRTGPGRFVARSESGLEVPVATDGSALTPVELLLAALGACTAVDVDAVVGRRVEPDEMRVLVEARKVRDADGNRLEDLTVTFSVRLPSGPAGDAGRGVLPRALQVSHERSCTVSRTIEAGSPVTVRLD